jgi:hypothetical protein
MTINDPKTYTAQWTLRIPIPREDNYGYFEYGCHEGNYAMPNLLADRARKRSVARKRRRAARRPPSTSSRRVAAEQAAARVPVVAAVADGETDLVRLTIDEGRLTD